MAAIHEAGTGGVSPALERDRRRALPASTTPKLWQLLNRMRATLVVVGAGETTAYHPVGMQVVLQPPRLELSGSFRLLVGDPVSVVFADDENMNLVVVEIVVDEIVDDHSRHLKCENAVMSGVAGRPRRLKPFIEGRAEPAVGSHPGKWNSRLA